MSGPSSAPGGGDARAASPAGLPRVSCICVTEGRAAFMPWLLWSFARQSWPNKELILIDSSEQPFELDARTPGRVVRAPRHSRVADKRNLGLRSAAGELLAFFDDDDWQHPRRLERLVAALDPDAVAAGPSSAWFFDLETGLCAPHAADPELVFNGALFRTEAVRDIPFDGERVRAADTPWMRAIAAAHPTGCRTVADEALFFWLSHRHNLSNPRTRVRCERSGDELRASLGAEAWLDTDAELDRLRARLAPPQPAPSARVFALPRIVTGWGGRSRGLDVGAPLDRQRAGRGPTPRLEPRAPDRALEPRPADRGLEPVRPVRPVSALIKATILDAPYLDVTLPHMLAQTGVEFSERLVVVDRRVEFSGKYRDRPRGTRADLERVLAGLLARGVIDRVLEVPTERDRVVPVMSKYFGSAGERMPTHAATGGPIFPTLFGLESAASDHVLQMDADMFFHADGVRWVERGLDLFDDPTVWFVMTHGGPPADVPGTRRSLGTANARRASFDAERRVWRFQTASTRYFLTDRRRLRGNVPALVSGSEAAPLERCLSAGLQQMGATRLCLALEGSWDLHAHFHGEPFPLWAGPIARLVESGVVPPQQRGQYDLRLDRPASREAWRRLIEARAAAPSRVGVEVTAPAVARGATAANTAVTPGAGAPTLPIAVVIAVRDRAGARVENALAALAWQSPARASDVVLVSLGSAPACDRELAEICVRHGVRWIRTGDPAEPWCKPLALNVGIRSVSDTIPFVMTLDVDMILAPNFLAVVHDQLQRDPAAFVLCQSSDLAPGAHLPGSSAALLQALERLRRHARRRGVHGCGGIQAATRQFFFDVRGYDQDLKWWGAEDIDMLSRATRAGRNVVWVTDRTFMLHQWHPRRHAGLSDAAQRADAQQAWDVNHSLVRERIETTRNPQTWGGAA